MLARRQWEEMWGNTASVWLCHVRRRYDFDACITFSHGETARRFKNEGAGRCLNK